MSTTRDARQVLADLELTSVTSARHLAPVVTNAPPESRPPSGGASPVDRWRVSFGRASGDGELSKLVDQARAELAHIRRRSIPAGPWRDRDDLEQRVLDGAGLPAENLALMLRCTPTLIRRIRLAHGCEPVHGRLVKIPEPDAHALVSAGLSIRAVAAVLKLAPSTVHERLHKHHHDP